MGAWREQGVIVASLPMSGRRGFSGERAARPSVTLLLVVAAAALAGTLLVPAGPYRVVILAIGATLLALAALIGLQRWVASLGDRRLRARVGAVTADDPTPCIATDDAGLVRHQNGAARARFGHCQGEPVTKALGGFLASPGALLPQIQAAAARTGHAVRDFPTRDGHLRLSAHSLRPSGCLWRVEALPGPTSGGFGPDPLAVPAAITAPDGTILELNAALRNLMADSPASLGEILTDDPGVASGPVDLVTPQGPLRKWLVQEPQEQGRQACYFLPPQIGRTAHEPALAAGTLEDFESLPVALIGLDADGNVVQDNAEARRLLEIATTPVPFSELVEGLGRPIGAWLRDALEGRTLGEPEILRACRVDPERFVQVTLRSGDASGDAVLIAVISDATELKNLEAKFVQSQKMQAIGQLAGGVAHDFNNLLTAISGHCDLLLLRHAEDDPDYPDLIQIHHNANRAASLVGQLLAFSRKQAHKPELLDLHDTLSDLTHLLNRLVGESVRLVLDLAAEPLHLHADKRQFEQVMMNLVVNARDAMPEGGDVTIAAAPCRLDTELRRDRAVVPPGDYIRITITDAGVGIEPEKLDRVFEPFYTTKRVGEGTGLGLSTVYGIMKQSGGFVFCDSEAGAGAVFTLYLPASAPADAQGPVAGTREAAPAGDAVVLLVEDEAPVRAFAGRALRIRGFSVIEADSAETALELLDDENLHVDIFVTDVSLPGIDGPGWVRMALERRPDTPTVFITGHAAESLTNDLDRLPNACLLAKPFSIYDLSHMVGTQLSRA